MIFHAISFKNEFLEKQITALVGGRRAIDFLLYRPNDYTSLSLQEGVSLEEIATAKTPCVLKVEILEHMPSFAPSRGKPYKILCRTESKEELVLVFFAGTAAMWSSTFKEGKNMLISGDVTSSAAGIFSMVHPKIMRESDFSGDSQKITPKYGLSGTLKQANIASAIKVALKNLERFEDWYASPPHGILPLKNAFLNLHDPANMEEAKSAQIRLAYDEIFAKTFAHMLGRRLESKIYSPPIEPQGSLIAEVMPKIGFNLTDDQSSALREILAEQKSTEQKTRLLQGDVGSGKTVVALLSCLNAVEAGFSAVVMAPTFILAKQIYESFKKICDSIGVVTEFFSSEDTKAQRRKKLARLESGEIRISIGTHALFSEGLEFPNLGFVVIDEQHRFGTKQRVTLLEKSDRRGEELGKTGAKTLLMSATPIPRTLKMALYGEIPVSYIKTKPAGRKEIVTKLYSKQKIPEITEAIRRKLSLDERIYWVCPSIEPTEEGKKLASITERYREFCEIFDPSLISVVHGKMKESEINREMMRFLHGETKIMIATTVIEVGVNVPLATVIVIEQAENFGLATLHQLRGRVGRGNLQSYCFLVHYAKSADILEKLNVLAQSNDGFYISEQDLKMRGGGNMLGKIQSGFEKFRFYNYLEHEEIAKKAMTDAKLLFANDPELQKNPRFLDLLKIYCYDEYIKFLHK